MILSVQIVKEEHKKPLHTAHGTFARPLKDFVESDQKSMVVTCTSKEEAMRCYHAFNHKIKKDNLNVVVWQKNGTVYVIKG